MEHEIATVVSLFGKPCDCSIEVDPQGNITCKHDPDCQYGKLLVEQERLLWMAAGMSTAILGYLKPEESYAEMPIAQVEEAIRLRVAFELACEALKPFYETARSAQAQRGKPISTNDLMCEFIRDAEKRIDETRKHAIPAGRAGI